MTCEREGFEKVGLEAAGKGQRAPQQSLEFKVNFAGQVRGTGLRQQSNVAPKLNKSRRRA